ncbi:jg19499 [Pararge aegeria aegeria]|uniref:Jg19499 protein n=1 Tax=Pararge aegeria aegeria TaxID=348720 RepID=A0A8S4RIL0_9NEOP|nr:jg19499 [Pararge aegeria aegeria]
MARAGSVTVGGWFNNLRSRDTESCVGSRVSHLGPGHGARTGTGRPRPPHLVHVTDPLPLPLMSTVLSWVLTPMRGKLQAPIRYATPPFFLRGKMDTTAPQGGTVSMSGSYLLKPHFVPTSRLVAGPRESASVACHG